MPPLPNPILGAIDEYAPGEQPQDAGFIKLNTNEFPYPAAPEVIEAIRRAATDDVRLYPSPRCERLRAKLAEYHGISLDNIFVGNGSDEVLRLIIQAYGGPGRMGAMVDPTYSLYRTLYQASGTDYQVYELEELERLPEPLYQAAWDLLLLPVPNAPLGTVFPNADVKRLADAQGLLALDEAYVDFADDANNINLAIERENVVATRTFSKSFGLAGMRVGYAVACPAIIRNLSKLADSYNVNRLSQVSALGAIEGLGYYRAKAAQIKADRAWLAGELEKRGFRLHASQANFLFARHSQAKQLYESLKAKKILVRYFSHPKLADGVRITIGTRAELERLLQEIDALGFGL